MHYLLTGPARDVSPCKTCPKKDQRPGCRKGCPKDEAWHKELERVKSNRREYESRISIGSQHIKRGVK